MYICVTHNPLLNISKRSKPAKLSVQGEFMLLILSLVSSDQQIVSLCLTKES